MEEFDLGVPERILESLPEEDEVARRDMQRAVAGLEARLDEAVAAAKDEREAAGRVADAIERLEDQLERYDDFVPELRAWGQSPIYAIAWRNLQADLIGQIQDVGWVAERLDRERTFRAVEDGIRLRDR
jgi:O6-methylguanine-DNA--protein-cysteine methyltransferase